MMSKETIEQLKSCETCKHWEAWKSHADYKHGIDECKMVVMWWDVSEWDYDAEGVIVRSISPQYKDQKAFVQDGSDYSASLYTRNDFGCVSYERKEA